MIPLLLFSLAGHAAEMAFVEPGTIVWPGELRLADYDRFIRLAERHPGFSKLKLVDSGDGDASVTRWMIWTVRGPGMTVEAEGSCIGACASIFINAAARRLLPSARTFLHVRGVHDAKTGALADDLRESARAASELSESTGRKLSLRLAFETLRLPDPRGGLFIYALPQKGRSGPAQVFFCKGDEPVKPAGCGEIQGATPESLGVVTPVGR